MKDHYASTVKGTEYELHCDSFRKRMPPEVILVAVDASRKISSDALDWALLNVAGAGSSVFLLAIVPCTLSSPPAASWLWGFPSPIHMLGGDCAATAVAVGSSEEELSSIKLKCSGLVHQLINSNIHKSKKVHTQVEVVRNADNRTVATEAKRLKVTWIVLDSHLKKEAKHCLEQLKVNVVTVNKSRPKIRRLDLKPDTSMDIDSSQFLNGTFMPRKPTRLSSARLVPSDESSGSSSPDRDFDGLSPATEVRMALEAMMKDLHAMGRERKMTATKGYHQLEQVPGVWEELSPSLHSPSRSPPLCSICQRKTPAFGRPPRRFSFGELQTATAEFSPANFIAEGGFGSVYRGVLRDGQTVAVKQYKLDSTQGDKEFYAEVEVLSGAQHRNLVMLIGYCIERDRRILVYEFVCNGSLDMHLHGGWSRLDWRSRRKIAIGTARALRYLHEECRVGCIVHRDMRPKNILLTHDFEAMVGDFGLARWQPDGNLAEATKVIGAFGYVAPEYAESGQITDKADVFAFGVVLLELLTGRKAVDMSRSRGEICLREWAKPLLAKHAYGRLVDSQLACTEDVKTMFYVASLCVHTDPSVRPRMSQVLRVLEDGPLSGSPMMMTPMLSQRLDSELDSHSPRRFINNLGFDSPSTWHSVQSSPQRRAGKEAASPEYFRSKNRRSHRVSPPLS